jgi:hypothetical protein
LDESNWKTQEERHQREKEKRFVSRDHDDDAHHRHQKETQHNALVLKQLLSLL